MAHTDGETYVVDCGEGGPIHSYSSAQAFAAICGLYFIKPVTGKITHYANAKDNAARLSLAWNCHDELVDVLNAFEEFESITETVRCSCGDGGEFSEMNCDWCNNWEKYRAKVQAALKNCAGD